MILTSKQSVQGQRHLFLPYMVSEYGGLVDVQDGHKMVSSSRKYINFKSTNHQFQGLELEGRLHDFMSTK